ncbi:hypothetical protein JOL62DRAFT_174314 [Phyllosticta paracitricarpa]|uniref:Uncharacterized protein n=1 Tax=Phyllosticta paracitricarpa TaxID=2016321 RepID=A0ABR1N414_9PEZI
MYLASSCDLMCRLARRASVDRLIDRRYGICLAIFTWLVRSHPFNSLHQPIRQHASTPLQFKDKKDEEVETLAVSSADHTCRRRRQERTLDSSEYASKRDTRTDRDACSERASGKGSNQAAERERETRREGKCKLKDGPTHMLARKLPNCR